MFKQIHLSLPEKSRDTAQYIQTFIEKGWIAPAGPELDKFEANLENLFPSRKATALNSGTSAIHLALILAGVKIGDDVLVATHTHNASVNPIKYLGANPILVDSELETWNVDPNLVEDYLKKCHKKPAAMIVVDIYGMPAKHLELKEILNHHGVKYIEDSAESLGSSIHGNWCGSFGDFGVLSFNGNKILTTGGGGALLTSSQIEKESAVYFATQAKEELPHFEHKNVGYNYRMNGLSAAFGNSQMQDLEVQIKKRRTRFNQYQAAFEELNKSLGEKMFWFLKEPEGYKSNRWLSALQIRPNQKINAEMLRMALEYKKIESRPFWKPMHMQPVFNNEKYLGGNVAEQLYLNGLCLPSGLGVNQNTIQQIIEIVKSVF